VLAQLEKDFPEDLRVVYRHFPLVTIHDKATLATQAAEAAGVQGAFWEMHNALYMQQFEWASLTEVNFRNWLSQQAEELGLDVDQFVEDLDAEKTVAIAQDAYTFGSETGIPQTPFLLINRTPYGGPLDPQNLSAIIKLIALEERQYSECPPMTIDPLREYIAKITTEKGEIVLQLFPDKTPLAVNSFVFLAREGWFDGVPFHRVIPGFVAQAGDPTGTGLGGPGYAFDNEVVPELSFDAAGLVGMANAGPGSNGSQFFITFAPQPDLNGRFTIFGQVLSGLDIAEQLTTRVPEGGGILPDADVILKVEIEEKDF
jgi:cyclophilin family peptidyl-prolyl cis-trans isomerase